jgi:hypothetical protein
MGGTASVVAGTDAGVVNVAVAPIVMAETDGWTKTVFVGASPDPASTLACPEPLSSRTAVMTPAPTTAAAAQTAPANFTPRLVGVRFVFITGSLRAHRTGYCNASVSSLIYLQVTTVFFQHPYV